MDLSLIISLVCGSMCCLFSVVLIVGIAIFVVRNNRSDGGNEPASAPEKLDSPADPGPSQAEPPLPEPPPRASSTPGFPPADDDEAATVVAAPPEAPRPPTAPPPPPSSSAAPPRSSGATIIAFDDDEDE